MKFFENGIRPRKIIDMLFLGTALLIIIPVVILGISLTWIYSSSFMKQTDRINNNTIDYVVELLEENLNTLYNAVYTLGNEKKILNYESVTGDNYERAMAYENISTTLSRLQVSNDIIEEIYIFYKNSDIVINAEHGLLASKDELMKHYNMSLEEIAVFLESSNGKFTCSNVETSEKINDILYAKVIDKRFADSGEIYAVFVLDSEFIKSLMDMISLEDVGQTILLDDSYNILLGDNDIYAQYEEKLKELFGNEVITNLNMPVLIKEIGLAKLNLCFVVDNSYYVTLIKFIWSVIILISIAVLGLSVFVAKFYIRRLYRPFGNIVNMFKPDEEDYGTKSELEFFEEKYVEIKNMKEELEGYKNSQNVGLKEMFFHNFMKGFYKIDYQQYMEGLNITFDAAYYTTILVKIDNFRSVVQRIKLSHYRSFIKDKLLAIFQDYHSGLYDKLYYFYDGECIGFIICHNENVRDLEHEISYVQRTLSNMLGITVSVCIGDTVTTPEELIEEYKRLSDAMMQMKFCKPATVLTMQEYKKTGKYVDFSQYKKKVVQCINERDYDSLNSLIDELFIQSNVFYTEVIQLVTGFLTVLAEILNKTNNRTFRIGGSEMHPYDEIGRMSTLSEIASYIKHLCHEAGDKIYAENSNQNELYDKIMSYISANYMKDISLSLMAKEFGLSSSYFSRCFKEITGKNYSEMIASYRVEKAKELIDEEDNIKLFQVAELVGFASYKAFAETFKKYAGLSPESYKKKKTEQNFLEY